MDLGKFKGRIVESPNKADNVESSVADEGVYVPVAISPSERHANVRMFIEEIEDEDECAKVQK